MATWTDIIALVVTLSVICAVIYGIRLASQQISESVQTTKQALRSKGLDISGEGISVKTSRRFDREDYVDATQRGFIKAMGASSFGPATPDSPPSGGSSMNSGIPSPKRQNSTSDSPVEEKKKRGVLRRAFSTNKDGK